MGRHRKSDFLARFLQVSESQAATFATHPNGQPTGTVVDLADPSPFNDNEWIGRGKIYIPENLPHNDIDACTTAGELPAAQKTTTPPSNHCQ